MTMSTLPNDRPIMSFDSAQAFDAWLEINGSASPGHGWIDGVKRSHDDKTFLQRFTPRGPRSVWSEINKKKMEELMKAKLVRPAGLATVKVAKANGQWDKAYAPASTIQVPPDLALALKKNKKARSFFDTLKSSSRYAFLHRLHAAKKEETRAKRLALFVGMMERGEAFHQ
jgi:uncharacterized protein YdeI (YjbR/CyaY-like superfamily)